MKKLATGTCLLISFFAFSAVPAWGDSDWLDGMSWLKGEWTGVGLGGESELYFTDPRGGAMYGMFRQYVDGEPFFYEIIKIFETDGGPVLRLKHFDAELKGWEEKDEWTEFTFVAVEENKIQFDGLTYVRDSENQVSAYVEILYTGEEEPRTEQFVFTRRGAGSMSGHVSEQDSQ